MARGIERIQLLHDDPATRKFVRKITTEIVGDRAAAARESRQAEELSRLQRAGVDTRRIRVLKIRPTA